jgi:hypothetical protein
MGIGDIETDAANDASLCIALDLEFLGVSIRVRMGEHHSETIPAELIDDAAPDAARTAGHDRHGLLRGAGARVHVMASL